REHVNAEHVRGAAVMKEQGREQPHERRLPGPVLAEDRHALAAAHLERQPVQRGDAAPAPAHARATVTADELLAQVVDLDSREAGDREAALEDGRGWARQGEWAGERGRVWVMGGGRGGAGRSRRDLLRYQAGRRVRNSCLERHESIDSPPSVREHRVVHTVLLEGESA